MGDAKLPRGALAAALAATIGNGTQDDDQTRAVIAEALEAAYPVIRRSVLRDAARQVLALDAAEREERRHPGVSNVGPWHYADASLRRLSRGEDLPSVASAFPDHNPGRTDR